MPFQPPQWAPTLQQEVPDAVSIPDFMLDEKHGRRPLANSRPPFVCGISGDALSAVAVKEQVEDLASGLAKEFGWRTNQGSALDKVVCVFSHNTIDYLPLVWAVHRLGGVVTPASSQFSESELTSQLRDSRASSIFTCLPLLEKTVKVAEAVGIPRNRVYLLNHPEEFTPVAGGVGFKSTSQLVQLGASQPRPEGLQWDKDEGKKRVAFLCYSSGTSGLPKGVQITHYNVIASVIQVSAFEAVSRERLEKRSDEVAYMENVLGLLPLSHIYGLVMIAHCAAWRGDSIIILPKFELKQYLHAVQTREINTLFLVPPIIILMVKNPQLLHRYNLSSVRAIFTGAAPLGPETTEQIAKLFPAWLIRQAYGLTETCSVVSSSIHFDIWPGSAGSLITGVEARLVSLEGTEVTNYGQPGELWVKSPSLILGYLNNESANQETFVTDEYGDRWMRTGDEVVIKKGPQGHEHLFIVDRIKELIKVKGHQVAPAELEAHLLLSPYVADCAIIATSDDQAGEVPKAYVVKSPGAYVSGKSDEAIRQHIFKHVQEHKSQHKWLRGGIEFLDRIPKSPSGKLLRRLLKNRDQQGRRGKKANL
ncbi:hypothetical protein LCI18_006293 [Fusarium solani-melongenae]|uniref:Uncharacterized protein n=1 Tax=Fusarium solani subsp. cucurbitae TaxID=2747967 RepID=A0ACD3Z5J0_FUSSC|nr:hypothetical protein LCI18_006293 [Fusarium solani-melongenae]